MSVVCTEICGICAILFNPLGNMLKDISLSAGNSDIGCRVGSSLLNQLHSKLLAGSLHDGKTTAHGLICKVTGE